jgi:N-acetylneuraminic acid mutarotase
MMRRFRFGATVPSMLAILAGGSLSACSGVGSGVPQRAGLPASDTLDVANRVRPNTSNTWMLGKPAPTKQFTGAAAAIGTDIYLLGGENHTKVLNENDVYHTATNTWSRAKRMPTGRAALAAAALNGLVYAISGESLSTTASSTS